MAFSGEESDGFLLGMSVQQCEIGVCQRTSEIVKEIFPGSKTITARVLSGITLPQRTKLLHVKEENGLPLQRLEGVTTLRRRLSSSRMNGVWFDSRPQRLKKTGEYK